MADASSAPPRSVAARDSALAPFRHKVFRAVWFASLASNFGGLIQSVGASWMMVQITDSANLVALVQASTTLPIMLFSLVAGAIADTYDRRKVMLTAQLFMCGISVLLAAAAYLGFITPWLLLTFTFLLGCGAALNGPAWQSLVGRMVPREDLPAAITLNGMGFNIARTVGPAVGGAIVAAAGAAAAFVVNVISYLPLITVLARWKLPSPPRTLPPETIGVAMAAGIRYVTMSPTIRNVLLRAFVFGIAASALPALMPLVARHLVQGGALTFGVLLGAFGAGAVGGALLSTRLRRALSVEGMVRLGFAGYAACVATCALSSSVALTAAAIAVGGACWVLSLSTFNVTVQLSAPRWVVGRALSLYQTAAFGGMGVGSAVWGALAEWHSPGEALLISALVHVIGIAIGLVLRLPDLQPSNLEPLSRWREPSLALDITPRSGPVVVTIEYKIPEEAVLKFLAAMAERRRIRRRDGARDWRLLRDLGDPEIWIERYQTPTWLDYVRHNHRITQADALVGDELRALHRGPEPPKVRRMIERQTGSLPSGATTEAHEIADPLTDPSRSS